MKKLILLFAILISFYGCNKDDSSDIENTEEQNTEIQENVVVILEENSQITSSESDLANGVYSIQFSGNPPEIIANDIIVGDQSEGFLRKVTSVSTNGNTITMQTTQANMEDVFKNAVIEFDTDLSDSFRMSNGKSEKYKINYLAKGVSFSGNGFEFDFSNTVLYQEGALTFEITDGTATFNPNFSFKGDYSLLGGLEFIDFKANNAELNIDLDVSLNASAGVSLPELSTTLADVEKKLKFLVGGVPVVVVVNTTLVAELSASIDSNFDITTGFTNNYVLSTSAKYENDNWTGSFDLNPSLTPKPINMEGEVNIAQNLTITPKVSVKFYGVIGPYCQPEMTENFIFNIASPSLDWDSDLKAGLDITTGVDITIFGYNIADFSRTDNFEETLWNAPETLNIVSGNNQEGTQGQQLAESLKISVKDKLDNSLSNVPVYFTVTLGGGAVDNKSVMTDENGFAEIFWTLGDNTSPQSVEVTVKKADGTNINSTVIFNANSGKSNSKWYQINYNITGYSDYCTFQEGKEMKYYINIIEDNNTYTGQVFFYNLDGLIGLPSDGFFPMASFGAVSSGLILSSEILIGEPGPGCDVGYGYNFSLPVKMSQNGGNIQLASVIYIDGNYIECNCPTNSSLEGYFNNYSSVTFIGTEPPSDL